MEKKEKNFKNLNILITILVFSLLLIIALPLLITWALNLPWWIGLCISLLPFISILFEILLHGQIRQPLSALTSIQFIPAFPVLFRYHPEMVPGRFRKQVEVKAMLENGDILLRRQEKYIDTLILGQTSYFTHAGIYIRNDFDREGRVWHATGSQKVHDVAFEEFAVCDELAVLRFDYEKAGVATPSSRSQALTHAKENAGSSFGNAELPVSGEAAEELVEMDSTITEYLSVFAIAEKIELPVSDLIEAEINNSSNDDLKALSVEELRIFNALLAIARKKPHASKDWRTLVTEARGLVPQLAPALKGRSYDFGFNFHNGDHLSCVEYVWVCYKSLFLFHQVRREEQRYFHWIVTHVVLPDSFLDSKFFKLVYNSVQEEEKCGEKLRKEIKSKRVSFPRFMLRVVLSQCLLVALAWCLHRLWA